MSYLVLARKYRPRQFSELVGQSHVATTLLNAFKQNKLGQAYLLTGTRGVGKTSVARIFAKALRCEDGNSQPGGKSPGISCEKCQSCNEINAGSSMDVLEIDGASNNGVENVREIREQVKFLPSRGRMKVYIIDEVHMLSNSAFNALLKTLEEPPAHVTFILATTEVQKIPPTILSRCQRFDFRRVPLPLIADHLTRLIKLEGLKAEGTAVQLIARKADGSVRDACSALDQCLALGGKELTVSGVSESLGIVSTEFLVKVLGHSLRRELPQAAELLQKAFLGGVEMKQVAIGLAETLRNALFVKLRASASIAEISEDEMKMYEELVRTLSPEAIQAAYRSITASLEEVLRSPLPRASLEMGLARLSGIGYLKSLEDLLGQLEGGAAPPQAPKAAAPAPVKAESTAKVALPVFHIPNPDPVTQPEKKSPETVAEPVSSGGNHASFDSFVSYVLQQKASLGAILEHALPVSGDADWKNAAEIKIGFRKSHAFYKLQAQHRINFDQFEKMLQALLKRKVKLVIEDVLAGPAQVTQAKSIVEKEKQASSQVESEKKKRFMEHEIVRDTKEIFGAELSSFDIDKSKP
ncbi:MAG TPA: DNA polymerase III subunit gamma/tau [Bdellovibrionota bacterium]|jgi:DNA polymerase-3 subunit gamma/tau